LRSALLLSILLLLPSLPLLLRHAANFCFSCFVVVPTDNGAELPTQHIPQLPDTGTAQTMKRDDRINTIHHVHDKLCTAQHGTAAPYVTTSSKYARKSTQPLCTMTLLWLHVPSAGQHNERAGC
jgi:hypothetical protein